MPFSLLNVFLFVFISEKEELVNGMEPVGNLQLDDSASGSFVSPRLIPEQVEILVGRNSNPNIVFYITRSKNFHTVVYRAQTTASGELDTQNPIDAYWQSFYEDSSNVIRTLREELGRFELYWAWGTSVVNEKYEKGKVVPQVRFTALEAHMNPPLRPRIEIFDASNGSATRIPRLVAKLNGRWCILFRAHVHATEKPYSLFPTVNWVNIHGIDIWTEKEIVVTIKP